VGLIFAQPAVQLPPAAFYENKFDQELNTITKSAVPKICNIFFPRIFLKDDSPNDN